MIYYTMKRIKILYFLICQRSLKRNLHNFYSSFNTALILLQNPFSSVSYNNYLIFFSNPWISNNIFLNQVEDGMEYKRSPNG
jgi:hypothetical protein